MNIEDIEEDLSASRYDLERAEEELEDAEQRVQSLREEIEFTRGYLARLSRRREKAINNKECPA